MTGPQRSYPHCSGRVCLFKFDASALVTWIRQQQLHGDVTIGTGTILRWRRRQNLFQLLTAAVSLETHKRHKPGAAGVLAHSRVELVCAQANNLSEWPLHPVCAGFMHEIRSALFAANVTGR